MSKGKYTEGQVCEFKYVKNVSMDEEFMIFEDKDRERFLIPARYYQTYNLQFNKSIKCLITRVDCTGKVSIEPEHPFYKLGGTYLFDFIKMQITEETEYNPLTGKSNVIKDYQIVVADRDGNEHHVFPKNWQKWKFYKTDTVKCRVNKIVKGHFLLTNLEEPYNLSKLIENIKSKINHD